MGVTPFCKETVFSLTSDYNNGALPCQCDFDGSLSFECEPFGGQCPCKPNIIGRRCEICKTGYFGFPNCKPCDCPSTALCETYTGECICPPRVTGERCNQCIAYTYGFDPIIGCEECNCEPLGVARGNLQCDLFNGSCQCKANVVGRTCDRCKAGNWGFPYCQHCDCDRRGTTDNICDQYTAECYCKNNVNGQACDLCNEGTFNIQEKNPDGCTKCFCFGKTPRCSSSSLYRSHLSQMTDWSLVVARVEQTVSVEPLDIVPDILPSTGIGVNLLKDNRVVYFSAPPTYLNNKLTAYGGLLNYTVYYTTGQFGIAVSGPDVILRSGDLYLLHFAIEQPPAAVYYSTSLDIVENEFLLASGIPASREQIMQTLENLEGIYIRATYWEESLTSRQWTDRNHCTCTLGKLLIIIQALAVVTPIAQTMTNGHLIQSFGSSPMNSKATSRQEQNNEHEHFHEHVHCSVCCGQVSRLEQNMFATTLKPHPDKNRTMNTNISTNMFIVRFAVAECPDLNRTCSQRVPIDSKLNWRFGFDIQICNLVGSTQL
uniref:Uncharacterized protein n=1 Tax=Timema bartmani TaxID=61472 RepID=A0A7R9ERD1_9NEOP|nr:unnamed protein product [Timema bartmani]